MVGVMKISRLICAAMLLLASPAAYALGGSDTVDAGASLGDRVVMVLGSRGNSCSGTAIRADVILTAAHCVRGAKQVVVAYFENGSPVLQRVRKVIVHPQASTNYRRTVDAAIVFLDEPLPPRFRKTELDEGDRVREPGEAAIIAGFGLQRSSNLRSGGVLRAANVVILPPPARRVVRIGIQTDGALSVCKGDSGGPIFGADMRLIGIVFGTEVDHQPALCGAVGQAIRIAPIRDWIDANLRR
jgi:S1-C subfamily serine protease